MPERSLPPRRLIAAASVAAAVLLLAPAAVPVRAQCKPLENHACVLTLRGQAGASPSCTAAVWQEHLGFGLEKMLHDSNGDGWWETTLRIDLDPAKGCGCAVFRAHYAREPQGFNLNIGDSPTNDGAGGDAGTTRFAAEVHVLDSKLGVYPVGPPLGITADMDQLLDLEFPALEGRILEIEICNQVVRFALRGGPPGTRPLKGEIRTPNTRRGFSIAPPPNASEAGYGTPDNLVYAAFNRVIRDLGGDPVRRRSGSGIAKVELFLTP